MAEWVWLDHPDLPGGPERFPNVPDVVGAAKARGFVDADDPETAPPPKGVEPDEVDDRGQGWVNLQHRETGGYGRFPIEAAAALSAQGWESVTALRAASAKTSKSRKKSSPEPVGDDIPKE
jgi:hypothetical protein